MKYQPKPPVANAPRFVGGSLCLDFANTVEWRFAESSQDWLGNYDALLAWSGVRGVLQGTTVDALRLLAAQDPPAADHAWRNALVIRKDIWTIADDLRQSRPVSATPLNGRLSSLPPQPPLAERSANTFSFDLPGAELEEPLWPILWSITSLLTSDEAAKLSCCQATNCGWLFIDASPTRTRYWCSNEGCGNRERVRRAYAKKAHAASADLT